MRPSELFRAPRLPGLAYVVAAVALVCGGCLGQETHPTGGERGSAELSSRVSATQQAARAARTARFLGGRQVRGEGSAATARAAAQAEHGAMLARPRAANLSTAWTAVGPAQVLSAEFGSVTGRVTAIAIDPADATGNTVYLGTTGGGVWKSTNAAGPAAGVSFAPLTDTLPVFSAGAGTSVIASLSIGALAIGNGVLLAGTGDPNDNSDSYYGEGILRSTDGGATWTLATQSDDGAAGNHAFAGLSTAGLAFSGSNPALVVAAMGDAAEGDVVNAVGASSQQGLFYSADAGVTWHLATVVDGGQNEQAPGATAGNAATAVVWNGVRQRFYAAVRLHGYYESSDGVTWTRLANQPGAGLTAPHCPAISAPAATSACPIFRGALAVQAASGDLFALTVDAANRDEGLYQDVCAATGSGCANSTVQFLKALNAAPLEAGSGSTVVAQADYDLSLAAVASGTDTLLYAGTVDLYRCSLAAGCVLRNTTNAQNGCLHPAGVAPAQHALAALGTLLFVGNDGGIYRSTDGVNETGAACSAGDAAHFSNLNGGVGSLAEVVSFAQDPLLPGTLLAGLGALGTAGTGSGTGPWMQLATGEGGTVAIDAGNPQNWFVSTGAGVEIARCTRGSACGAADFTSPVIGEAQVADDVAAIHAPWLLDPALDTDLLVGTCRVWRGPAAGGVLWSSSNAISAPFAAPGASGCTSSAPVVRSLGAGGPASGSANAQNAGSEVIYAGLAGVLDGGTQALGGHVFTSAAAQSAASNTAWTDAAKGPVTNDTGDGGVFNPGGFDISSIAVDPHDATGRTVYATVMGFAGNGVNAPHVYRSVTGGASWTNISSNLPNAPANSLVVDPNDANTLYVAMDTGVYVTTTVTSCTAGNCWSVYGSGLPNAPVVQLEAAAGMATGDGRLGELRAATYGRGIWELPLLTAISPAAPALTVSPSTVTYSAQGVGTASPSVTVTVTNTGNAPLTVTSVTTTGDFFETDQCTSGTIAQGASCTVEVVFLPAAVGTRTGVLTVYGNVAGGQATAALSGTGTAAAAVVLTPTMLSFPATTVGATSAVQNITVSNTGGTATTLLTPVVTGDFQLVANTCGSSLAAQTGCTLSLVFAPLANGTRTGTLTVGFASGTAVASLTATAISPPTDGLAPAALAFAAQPLNTVSAAQQVTLTNNGDTALTLIGAAVTSGDFTVVNGCGSSLNAHASCALSVAFVPKSVGTQAGVLTISDVFRSQTVQLTGMGLAPAGVSLSPVNGLSFAATGVGLSSAVQTVTVTNNGGVPLLIASVGVSGEFVLLAGANTCAATLAPAGVCTVGIVFSPTGAGARTGTVTFSDSAANSPQTAPLTGTGVDFMLAPEGPQTMTVASGGTATYTLLLSSAAGLAGAVGFTCSGMPAHTACTVNPGAGALGGMSVVTVTLATGDPNAWLSVPPLPWSRPVGLVLAGCLPIPLLRRRRRGAGAQAGTLAAAVVAGLLLLGALSGCETARTVPSNAGSGGTGAGSVVTPSGSSTIVVAGASAGLVRSVNLTLVVQ